MHLLMRSTSVLFLLLFSFNSYAVKYCSSPGTYYCGSTTNPDPATAERCSTDGVALFPTLLDYPDYPWSEEQFPTSNGHIRSDPFFEFLWPC